MAPPGSTDERSSSKKARKSKSKEEGKHKRDAALRGDAQEEASKGKKRKHKGGQEEVEEKQGKRRAGAAGEATERDEKTRRAMEDERFAAARTDPRFRPMRRKEGKVAIDSRFSSMLTDPRFASSTAPVDKRGRRRKKKGPKENPMLQYYLHQEEEEEEKDKEKAKLIGQDQEEVEEEEEEQEEEEEESSSSDDDDENEDEEDDDDGEYSVGSDIAHYLMGQHDDTPRIEKETHRLAVVNMDWDHIKAVDLYMVMTSCVPKGGRVLSVSVYPSEFGLKCMEVESTKGPSALVNDNGSDGGNSDSDDEDEENSDSGHDSEDENNKLRSYELNRLRYYYAVVECDSSATANHLYMSLDGTEFLKTSNVFDVQFIPDSMEFKHPARDVATEAPPSYKEPNFETRALQHSRVKLTWDDDEPERKKILRQKFTDDQLDELDMYLANDDSASDDEGEDDYGDESLQNGVAKGKLTREERLALLLQRDKSDEEQTDGQDMEVTFNTDLEDLSKRILERKSNDEKTVWEKHQEKMKEKRRARKRMSKEDGDYSSEDGSDEDDDFFDEESDDEIKTSKKQKSKPKDKGKGKGKDKLPEENLEQEATREELELLVAGDKDTTKGAKGYNLKRKKSKKGKKGKEQSAEDELPEIDLTKDERFSEIYTSHLFALDPTDPQYKRSADFMRKHSGKQGAHAGRVDRKAQVNLRDRGTLPPDEAATKNDELKPDGASKEKLQILSAVKSLKRNLNAFNNSSTTDR